MTPYCQNYLKKKSFEETIYGQKNMFTQVNFFS